MVNASLSTSEFRELLDSHPEWLLVSENGRTFPINGSEVELSMHRGRSFFGLIEEKGFRARRVVSVEAETDGGLLVTSIQSIGGEVCTMRLVPRVAASEMAATVELARLARANEIATLIESFERGGRLVRVGLSSGSGRFAQIIADAGPKRFGVFADVAGGATAESMLTSAIRWFERLKLRSKRPARELHIVVDKRAAANLQKLHTLLKGPVRAPIRIFETNRKSGVEEIRSRAELSVSRLWREKPKKLNLPDEIAPSETASRIIERAPDVIDIIHSRNGETLRFNGMAFARVRRVAGRESAWFGIDRVKRPLNDVTRPEMERLVEGLKAYRTAATASKRHEFYRHSPESWLESVLRRNIKLLDANLILAPIYNQFRTFADKIDLLALRKDGRLVVIEIKASPDRETPFQAADYWRKIEHLRRRGELKRANVFDGLEIIDKPALVYAVAPALSFHRDFEYFARMLTPEIELWRFELHENWREEIKVIARRNYFE